MSISTISDFVAANSGAFEVDGIRVTKLNGMYRAMRGSVRSADLDDLLNQVKEAIANPPAIKVEADWITTFPSEQLAYKQGLWNAQMSDRAWKQVNTFLIDELWSFEIKY